METTDRRRVVAALGLFAGLAVTGPPGARQALGREHMFNPPEGPARLVRVLIRDLTKDAQIAVERVWAVEFDPIASGYRLDGQQIAATVEAPEALRGLADIERARIEKGFLPLSIDRSGMIMDGVGESSEQSVTQAIAAAREQLEAVPLPNGARAEAMQFMRQLHARASESLSRLPRDIFLPRLLSYSQEQAVPLPGTGTGTGTGRLVVDFWAELSGAQDCLLKARREVRTEYAGTAQRSLESWELTAA